MNRFRLLLLLSTLLVGLSAIAVWNSDLGARDVPPRWTTPNGEAIPGTLHPASDIGFDVYYDRNRYVVHVQEGADGPRGLGVINPHSANIMVLPVPTDEAFRAR